MGEEIDEPESVVDERRNGKNNSISSDDTKSSNYANDASQPRQTHYLQNIKLNDKNGFSNGKDNKDILLTDTTTVLRFSPVWKQSLAAAAPILVTLVAGLTLGYSAILLPQLKDPTSPIPGDESTASWIAAMAALPMAPGCLVSGWIMEKFGRRLSQFFICGPFLLGWIFIAYANDLSLMLLGRFLTGICVGLLGPLGPVYISETSEPKYRGLFLAAISLAMAMGMLVAHLMGTFLTWKLTAMISCIFPLLSFAILTVVPESPIWLIKKGRLEEGVKSFGWLRGYGEEAKEELKTILENQKVAAAEPELNWKEKVLSLKSPELIKPLLIMIFFFVTCQFSGINAVAFYSIEIVEKTVGKGIDHYLAMLIIDLVRLVMSIAACVISKKYGRRPVCFISGIWTSLSMIGLSMFLYWTDCQRISNMSWLPLSFLMIYICAISIGFVPLPWIMCGEMFPTKVRGIGSGISSATAFVAFFIVVKTAPGMMSNLGEVITFLIYGLIALIGTTTMYFILPETKGKSLQEIEESFRSGRK